MDKEALEHLIARRLLDHVTNGTTDMADEVIEVPATNYTTPERHAEEVDALFLDHPLLLCLSGALPEPGSYITVDICDTPIVVVRDPDGSVRSFANMCRHRGVRLVDGTGKTRRITCPFHAWTYNLEGELVGIPVAEAFDGMCREDKGLIELPVAEGHGLVVGRLRPGDPVDIDEFVGPELAEELALLDFAGWALYSEPHNHDVGANWKTTLDTYRENYHFDYLHKNTLAEYAYGGALTFDPMGRHLRNASALRSIDELKGVPEEEWGDVSKHFSYQYAIFPNVSLTFDSRHIELWQILPTSPTTSTVIHSTYMVPNLSEEETAKLVDMAPWICETVVDGEDFWVAGRTDPGLRTNMMDTVVFGRNEPALQHLHRNFEEVLAAKRG
jgi:phenylpropionate dioxygenase-like ring-hydroxylating dioxygenase large terminal subunit